MSVYSPPTESLPIFDSELFLVGDLPLTYNQAKKKFLKYPTAQGLESFPNGLNSSANSTFSTTTNGVALTITTPGTTNTGLTMVNSTISQTGATNTQNSLHTTNINNGGTINFGTAGSSLTSGGGLVYNDYATAGTGLLSQFVNSANNYIWNFFNGSTNTNILTLNNTSGLTITPPIFSSYIIPSTSDNSTRVPTTSWVQSVIGSTASNITPNSVTITPSPSISSSTGITCYYNSSAKLNFSGSGGNNNGAVNAFVANNGVQFDFLNGGSITPSATIIKYSIIFTFWNSSSFGETSCLIDFYPNRWTQGVPAQNQTYNINNKINGNQNYVMTDATYAPSGRQYWTYNQYFSGISGPNALFQPHNGYWNLYFCIPDNTYSYSCEVRALDTSSAQNIGEHVQLDLI